MEKRPTAFVLMPFDAEFDEIYERLIKPSLEGAGYQVMRADSLLDQRSILREIILGITRSDLIIADLTTNNPNVFYELGLCHALKRPTILLAQSINDVPFDLRSYKIHIYDTHFGKIKKLREFLTNIGEKHRRKEISFENPVTDFSFIDQSRVNETTITNLSAEKPGPSTDEVEENELFDFLLEGEKAAKDLTGIVKKVLKDNELLTNKITRHAANMQALSNNPTAGSAGRLHKLSLLASTDMNSFSKKIESVLPFFETTVEKLSDAYLGYLKLINPQENQEALYRLRDSMDTLLMNSTSAKEGLHSFREASLGLGEKKLSKDLTRASRRQAQALDGLITNIERVEAFSSKMLEIIDAKGEA